MTLEYLKGNISATIDDILPKFETYDLPRQTEQIKTTSNGRRPQNIKVEYFSSHCLDPTKI